MELTWRNFWFETKASLKETIGMSEDLLHVHFGLAGFLSTALLFLKFRRGALTAWFVVVVFQAINEALDARDWVNWTGNVNWPELMKDTAATLFWPTMLLLLWSCIGRRTKD